MKFLKFALLIAITLTLPSCDSNREPESEVELIKNHVLTQIGFGFDEDSLLIKETNDPSFKLALFSNELGPQLMTLYNNDVEGIHLVGSEEGPTDTPIYWTVSRNDDYEIMAGLIYDNNITDIQIRGVEKEDIQIINYGNIRYFFTSSNNNLYKNPVTIKCYDTENNLVYTTTKDEN